jgi:hypothetical protein
MEYRYGQAMKRTAEARTEIPATNACVCTEVLRMPANLLHETAITAITAPHAMQIGYAIATHASGSRSWVNVAEIAEPAATIAPRESAERSRAYAHARIAVRASHAGDACVPNVAAPINIETEATADAVTVCYAQGITSGTS